eukprot:scaffold7576_cov61-Phaeocystis_antarctica.AAC.4
MRTNQPALACRATPHGWALSFAALNTWHLAEPASMSSPRPYARRRWSRRRSRNSLRRAAAVQTVGRLWAVGWPWLAYTRLSPGCGSWLPVGMPALSH